jgi:4-aminobutyrate aminotransferase-like enzyme/Ser/Thr protein kinase RdoA (MazF antagonist)
MRSAPPVFSIAEAERIARDIYGVAVSASPLSGERDCNFHLHTADGHDYVLKVLGAEDPQTADCQVRVLRHLAEQDPTLPVPRVHATLQGADLGTVVQGDTPFPVLLTAFLPGRCLSDSVAADSVLRDVGGMVARLDTALQGFFHPALSQHIAWDVRRLPELFEFADTIESPDVRRNVERVVAMLKAALPSLRGLRSQAIHGDCHGGNVLLDPAGGVSGILDFGDMIHAPLILEPAVAMAELVTDVTLSDAMAAVIAGYARTQDLGAADIAVLYDLVAARHGVTLLLHAWRNEHDGTGARILDQAAAHAAAALEGLLRLGREASTSVWHRAAGTSTGELRSMDLGRRHRLMGAGAELFYEQPLHLVRGNGVWLYDPQGRAYLDVYNNVPHVGHCHPTVVRAIQRQTAVLATHTRYFHDRILEYAEQLTARCPPHLDACIFVNSGSEANDVAWRLAQFATGHAGAVIMAHAYHGITDAVAALTPGAGEARDPRVVTLAVPPVGLSVGDPLAAAELAATAADADAAIRTLAERGLAPAALFIDSALTSSGIYDPPPAWAEAVTARVRAAGGVVVADEVQYGLGRSGTHFWGFERRGLTPDIVTLGKPVGNGYPMGVVIARRALIEAFQVRFGFFSTFGGNAVAASAGLAVLDVLDREQLVANARSTGEYLRHRLEVLALQHDCLGGVRGAGLLLGLEVLGAAEPAVAAPGVDAQMARRRTRGIVNALASRARVLIGAEGPQATLLKLRPPMTFRPEHADLLVQAIAAAAADVETHG